MALLEWKPEFSVGNASIDHEHEHMIQAINDLYEQLSEPVNAENVEAILGEIHADISAHFALEEHLMQEAGYIEYEDHKEDHEDLLDQILELMDSFFEDPEAGQKMLKTQLSDWFSHHFASFDARLHKQLGE
jgi:hemerythrin